MVKNLQDYLKTGRDPAYLKNGDTITEELARELICAGDEDVCLDGEFEITQSRIVEDIIGGEGVYETIWRESPDHPWTYVGLCKAGMEALKRCDQMVVIIRQEGPEDEWISQGMQAEITAAAKMGIEPQFIYIGKEKR